MIPKKFHHAAKKAGDRPSYVVNVIVDPNCIVQSVSRVYYGATNDMVALNADEHFAEALANEPLFTDAEYTVKDIEGNDVIETGNYFISDGGYCQDKRLMFPVKAGRLNNTPSGLFSRQIENQRKDIEDTFSHIKNAFATFDGPLRFNNPKHVEDLFRTLFFFHNKRARALNHHEIGQDDGDWKPTPQKMEYEPTEMDVQFAQRWREGVADGQPGRAAYIVDESRTDDRKKNWADRTNRLAQHVTYKDSKGELKWPKTHAELNIPKR